MNDNLHNPPWSLIQFQDGALKKKKKKKIVKSGHMTLPRHNILNYLNNLYIK